MKGCMIGWSGKALHRVHMLISKTDRQTLRGVLGQDSSKRREYSSKRSWLSSWAHRQGAGKEVAANRITERESPEEALWPDKYKTLVEDYGRPWGSDSFFSEARHDSGSFHRVLWPLLGV